MRNDDFLQNVNHTRFESSSVKLVALKEDLITSMTDDSLIPKAKKGSLTMIHTYLSALSGYLNVLKQKLDNDVDKGSYDNIITMISGLQIRLM